MGAEVRYLDVPVAVSPAGGLRTCDAEDHLRDLVLQVLLTEPGERVNRPDFGCGVRRLVFSGSNEVLRTTAQFLITQNLDRWLGDRLRVEQVDVRADPGAEEVLRISVVYVVRQTGSRRGLTIGITPTGAPVLVAATR
jgi:phage baseplate assembly protein W